MGSLFKIYSIISASTSVGEDFHSLNAKIIPEIKIRTPAALTSLTPKSAGSIKSKTAIKIEQTASVKKGAEFSVPETKMNSEIADKSKNITDPDEEVEGEADALGGA